MVGAGRFELPTPGPPDRCANRAALRSDVGNQYIAGGTLATNHELSPKCRPHLVRTVAREEAFDEIGVLCRASAAASRRSLRLSNPVSTSCSLMEASSSSGTRPHSKAVSYAPAAATSRKMACVASSKSTSTRSVFLISASLLLPSRRQRPRPSITR